MERKTNQIRLLQVCLLLWIGISVSVAQDTTEETITAAPDSTGSPMANTNGPEDTATAALPQDQGSSTDATMTESTDGNMIGSSTDTIMTETTDINGTITDITFANITESCHLFNCMGDHCYRNESQSNDSKNVTCPTYCALFRHNSSYFASMCDPHCKHHMCTDSAKDNCTIRCCNAMGCSLDSGNDGNQTNSTMMPSTAVMSTSTTTTTTAAPLVYSDNKCRSFKCDGTDCFKTQTTAQTKQCQVGIKHCELQKMVKNGAISYEAGCSNTCSTSTKSCAAITNADCFLECCNATTAACCMKLDGQVHFNTAPLVHKGSILKLFSWAFFIIYVSRFISSK